MAFCLNFSEKLDEKTKFSKQTMILTLFFLIILSFQEITFAVYIIDCPMGHTFDASQKKCVYLGGGVPVCAESHTYASGGNEIQICRDEKLVYLKSCDFGITTNSNGDAVCASQSNNTNQGFLNGGLFVLLLILVAVILSKNKRNTESTVQITTRFCSKCGSGLAKNSKFCPKCSKKA